MTGTLNIYEVIGRPPIHPFPARMAPGLVLDALSTLSPCSLVLDPMVGSGTVLAVARSRGHRCIGFDVDPLAVLISRVWTRALNHEEVREAALRVFEHAKVLSSSLLPVDAFPVGADEETRAFSRYWFDFNTRRQLAALTVAIHNVQATSIREALWCAFSRQIIAKQSGVSLALDLAHSRPHRVFSHAPRRPFAVFLEAVDRVLKGCVNSSAARRGPPASVKGGDARCMQIADSSIDLVFTSPPYLNAIDYIRCSKFSLVWMGYSVGLLRSIRASSIGSEVSLPCVGSSTEPVALSRLYKVLPSRTRGILQRYVLDMQRSLVEVARVLAPGGRAVYVIGENTIRGTYVPTGRLIAELATKVGLRITDQRARNLPGNRRYLPPPGNGRTALDTRIRREVILTLE